jgi:hypothetical protein
MLSLWMKKNQRKERERPSEIRFYFFENLYNFSMVDNNVWFSNRSGEYDLRCYQRII